MRDAKDRLARASEMERRAGACGAGRLATERLSMAQTWRCLAQQALWQAAFTAQTHQDSDLK